MSDGSSHPALSRGESFVLLAAAVLFFLVGMGPVWQHPWDVDRSILYSYAPIPFLVALALLRKRRLGWRAWGLHTLELVFAKFIVTACILVGIWATSGAPPKTATPLLPPPVDHDPHVVDELPEIDIVPTSIAPESTGTVTGVVVDARGTPVAGALVFVSAGLERFVFAPPREPVVLENGGRGLRPELAVVMVGQKVLLRSADVALHTVVAESGGRWRSNTPIPAGRARPIRFKEAQGVVNLRCTVHPGEQTARLVVLGHPFFAFTPSDGRFTFAKVPAAALRVSALTAGGESSATVKLRAGGSIEVRLTVPGA